MTTTDEQRATEGELDRLAWNLPEPRVDDAEPTPSLPQLPFVPVDEDLELESGSELDTPLRGD